MTTMFGVRKFGWAVAAVAATIAVHGSWLTGLDRDAIAVTAVATA